MLATETPRRLSRRHTRILWTLLVLLAAGAIGGIVAWRHYVANRPEEYEPGEQSADVTSTVTEQHKRKEASQDQGLRIAPAARRVDALRNPGQPLPPGAPAPAFTDVTKEAGLAGFRSFAGERTSQLPEDMGSGAAWGDFDNDGYEDVFLVSAGGALTLPPGERAPSLLFRNLGNGTFQQVDGFPETRIPGMAAAWADYNNDGWLDLVVTGIDTILLFRNEHGKFVPDKALPSPKGFWTGAAWGDFNNDGNLDLYVCGYVRYKPDAKKTGTGTQQFGLEVPYTLNPASFEAERNLLFRNNGDGTFTEAAAQLGVANPEGRSLSALWHDFDGDGRLDLYVANDISENKLYLNRHGKFVDAGKAAWISEYRGSMGLAAGDFDRDGDDDLFISHWIAQQYALYQSLLGDQKRAAKVLKGGAETELHFTDVAEVRGIGQPSMQSIGWGAAFADFDSDGWLDLAVANGSTFESKDGRKKLERMPSFLFWNDRGEFFRDLAPWNESLAKPHVSRGLAAADYDNDGAVDILIVDHGEGVRLLRNDVPHGNWIEFRLKNRVGRGRQPAGFGDGATVVAWADGVQFRRTVTSASYLSQDSRRVHIGLGKAARADRVEVHWLGGKTESWANLEGNRIWELVEGEPAAAARPAGGPAADQGGRPAQARLVEFWEKQRAAMDAMKKENNPSQAARLFREALALNPGHEDSYYYLANCLAAMGDVPGAIAELDKLARSDPHSHRAFQRRGELMAASATTKAELARAEESLETAHRLNPEETGTLLLMGEVSIAKGDLSEAARRFELACRANPRAGGALFLRGYIAWRRGDSKQAASLLAAAHATRGKEWKPKGSVAEGDVQRRMYRESGFLNMFWEEWDGSAAPAKAFAGLNAFVTAASKAR